MDTAAFVLRDRVASLAFRGMTTPRTSFIDTPQRVLLGPGPSDVPARVLSALARPTIGHLDPVFLQLMDDIRSKLKQVFRTNNEMTLAVSGTGSAGMETLFVNCIEPGDKVLIAINGVFGGRMKDVADPQTQLDTFPDDVMTRIRALPESAT